MHRYPLAEIRHRTDKSLDAWWTVLLVDPFAVRLVRLVAPYRWMTPSRLTALAGLLGLGAAVAFAAGGRGWPAVGALLFHLGFVADCVAGRIARLRGVGTPLGAWCGFMVHRMRAIVCAAALMGGQYTGTGQARYLWLAALVIALDLLRYLNAGQMASVRAAMRRRTPYALLPPASRAGRLRAARIRSHLVSGIEFEMFVFVVAPLTGWIVGTTLVIGALLAAFEVRLVVAVWRAARRPAVMIPAPVPQVYRSLAAAPALVDRSGADSSMLPQGAG